MSLSLVWISTFYFYQILVYEKHQDQWLCRVWTSSSLLHYLHSLHMTHALHKRSIACASTLVRKCLSKSHVQENVYNRALLLWCHVYQSCTRLCIRASLWSSKVAVLSIEILRLSLLICIPSIMDFSCRFTWSFQSLPIFVWKHFKCMHCSMFFL